MPKSTTKGVIKLTVDIRSGPTMPSQRVAYRHFWAKLISKIKDEVKANEPKCE